MPCYILSIWAILHTLSLHPSIHPSIHPALLRAERGSKLHVGSARVWSRDLCKGAGCSDGLPAMVEGLLPPEMRLHKRAAGNRAALFLRPPFLFSRQDRCIIYYPCFLVTDETRSSNFHTSIISHIERSRTYIHLYFVVFASPIYKPPSNSISISISLTLFPTHSFIPPPPPPAMDPTPTPTPTPPPPDVTELIGVLSRDQDSWSVSGTPLDLGGPARLNAPAGSDFDQDGILETAADELTGLEGRQVTLEVERASQPAVVRSINGLAYLPE